MAYLSLYRKYRSQTFDDVVGQEHVTRTLQNAIKSDRIGHAYLFCGSRGTGKTTVARLLAKAVNCEHGPTPTPCGECEACLSIAEGSAVDVIEMDAASHRGVADMKEIRDNIKFPPMRLRYKVYVIDEVHQLSSDAKDAFLKTLEEPPAHAIFVLATTEAHEIPLTIRSRCQQFDFRRGSISDIVQRLRYVLEKEGREFDEDAVLTLARSAQGSYRDSLSLLEQVLTFTDDRLTAEDVNTVLGMVDEDVLYQVSEVVASQDAGAAFELAGRLILEGKDIRELLKAIAGHFRDLLAASVGAGTESSLKAAERGRQFTKEQLVSLVEIFSTAERDLRWTEQHRLGLEMAMLKAITPQAAPVPVQAPVQSHRVHPAQPAQTLTPTAPLARTPAAPTPRPTPKPEPPRQPQPQPPPQSAAEEPVQAAQGEVTVEQLRRVWNRVLAHIKDVQNKKLMLGVLREAQIVGFENNSAIIGFDPRLQFHVQRFQRAEDTEPIRRAFEAILGRKVGVKVIAITAQEPEAPPEMEMPSPVEELPPLAPDGEPDMVKDVLDMFGGKIVDDVENPNYDPWKES